MKISLEEAKEITDDILNAIECEYQCPIARLAYFKLGEKPGSFQMGIIFVDYRILDADITFIEKYGYRQVLISGSII